MNWEDKQTNKKAIWWIEKNDDCETKREKWSNEHKNEIWDYEWVSYWMKE